MHSLNSMSIKATTADVLTTLRTNREKHRAIVVEARKGYVDKARHALKKRLDDLESGKIVGLRFSLDAPLDYTKVYDTAIRMLELHQEPRIALDSGQVRNLVMDEWDWSGTFFASSSRYSATAAAAAGDAPPDDE